MKGFSQKKESARLEKLRGLEILDTPTEPAFNRLVRLTARMFGVKMAAISLVDEYRRWFKAFSGLSGPREAFRDVSFCGRTVLSEGVFVVCDAQKDPAYADFPLVTGRNKVRFYAGAPLVTSDGWRLGALCIMSQEPRTFTPTEAQSLQDLAAIVIDEIVLRQMTGRLRAEVAGRKSTAKTLTQQHRLLQKLSGSQENHIRERTAELNRVNKALNAEIARRERTETALNLAKEEAEKANHAKSEYLSRMSHELRTPLNAILGFGQILHAQVADASQKDCASHVVTAGNHLLDLINEVLDFARIEAGKVELSVEPVRVENLVAETIDLIRPLAGKRRIEIVTNLSGCGRLFLLADRQRCKQVLLNLLSNAVKYSPEEAQVRIECRSLRSRELRIAITDHGPGIAPEKLSRLFIPFDRLGAEHSTIEGTGLGLTLSKHLVEAMGGSIGVKSVPCVGSTFWLQLPRHRGVVRAGLAPLLPALGGSMMPRVDKPASEGCTVLYIEDNASNLRLIEHLCSRLPEVQLLTARSGAEGLAMARRFRPHLVLLDLNLPDLPGWEVLARLRADRTTADIPVVAVSADASPDSVERLIQAGAYSYLTKPLNLDNFYDLLPTLGLNPRSILDNPTLN